MSMHYKKYYFFVITGLTIINYKTYAAQVPSLINSNLVEQERQEALNENTNNLVQKMELQIFKLNLEVQQITQQLQSVSSDIQETNDKITQIHNAVIPQKQKNSKKTTTFKVNKKTATSKAK